MDAKESKTPTDVLIEVLENCDNIQQLLVIYRRSDGTIGYRCANQQFADSFGLMHFAQISMEYDLRNSFSE